MDVDIDPARFPRARATTNAALRTASLSTLSIPARNGGVSA